MLSPTDFLAIFATSGGSLYGAVKQKYWPDTFQFRAFTSTHASMFFLLAFAGREYMEPLTDNANMVAGVAWTRLFLTEAMPAIMYLVIMLVLMVAGFYFLLFALSKRAPTILTGRLFPVLAILLQVAIGVHALTLDVIAVDLDNL